ncbi:MAG: bifunctional hydroxymethylpyrimidine kinase/phosphomethylpyrimidine kinase [Nitriliruptoraceae bacterium]
MRTIVLTVAGSDSGAGAGIQADLKTISAHGAYGVSVLTAVTAQNTRAVTAALALPPDLIEAQFDAIFDDFAPAATKSGMLADRERIEVVAAALRRYSPPHYVLDPVMISKSGFALLAADAVDALRAHLLPLADVLTPNVHEAQLLAEMEIRTVQEARTAGARILEQGPRAVIVKGGHLAEQPGTDVLVTREGVRLFEGEFVESGSTHGTGCTFSAAIAAQLAHGRHLDEAVALAKAYLTEAIRSAVPLGSGSGPTDHFFYLRQADPAAWTSRLGITGELQSGASQ